MRLRRLPQPQAGRRPDTARAVTGQYLLSPAAQADLEQIWDYTYDRWGVDQADYYLRELQHAVNSIAENPGIGRACDEIRPGYRKLAAGSHTLFYQVTEDGIVDVVRILHQRMDVDRHL
ncbi:type II toxin-antitoxin system RelE/ParE family toxin [Mycobacterium heidelbergense]|uniref:Plasmid stabilization protein ParE n=1 Tax=Mycobacterium heidelbergense TaxID=53376 RepID=A0A1X0DGC6_MYCHE|nr:type II toxin-antitoxin system RelE/ParE family toxin [Mycobacterium heidelbergense]MCV7051681.1 type II toxin-antitoxin system RelE/ParE family toxin [Mycobacterium heidelbergense]ORA71435.1 plasmid stabilization protein ParE [Mycobacterium heidelbergense]